MQLFKNLIAIFITISLSLFIISRVHAVTVPKVAQREAKIAEEKRKNEADFSVFLKLNNSQSIDFALVDSFKQNDSTAKIFSMTEKGIRKGFALHCFGKGYQSVIHVAAVIDTSLVVQGICIVSQNETPGLGDRVCADEFCVQFKGKSIDQIKLVPELDTTGIQAIASVTISCRAVTEDALRPALDRVKSLQ